MEIKVSAIDWAAGLFFGLAPYLDPEPSRALRDEGISDPDVISVLEAIGRGAAKASEIACRLRAARANLSRLLQRLLDASVRNREIPFGTSRRAAKKGHYTIQDPALRFWFRVCSPHRTR